MKSIPLTQGMSAMVDDEDFDEVSAHKWFSMTTRPGKTYAGRRRKKSDGPGPMIVMMHRSIKGARVGFEVDHADGNGLNNTRGNLRECSTAENQQNAKRRVDNASGFRGVHWHTKQKKWRAVICINGKTTHLGSFASARQAAAAYLRAAREKFGAYLGETDATGARG